MMTTIDTILEIEVEVVIGIIEADREALIEEEIDVTIMIVVEGIDVIEVEIGMIQETNLMTTRVDDEVSAQIIEEETAIVLAQDLEIVVDVINPINIIMLYVVLFS